MRFVVVGYSGYWGKTLCRCLTEMGHQYYGIDQKNVEDFGPERGDAVIIATPPETHYFWAMRAMKLGLDVLVEKPMAMNYAQAKTMADYANQHGVVLSVDSTFVHTAAFGFLRSLGQPLLSYQSIRLAPPMPQARIAAGWDLIVHDLSIIQGLGGFEDNGVGSEDGSVAQCAFGLPSGGSAFIFASRAWPTKERQITLHYPGGTYLWTLAGLERVGSEKDGVAETEEPLKRMLADFELRCVERQVRGVTDGSHGAEVVKCLERLFPAHTPLGMGGRTVGDKLLRREPVQHLPL